MTRTGKRQFSTTSIRVLADNINSQVHPNAVDSVLQTLAQIDEQIHTDFKTVQAQLEDERLQHSKTRQKLNDEHERNKALQNRLQNFDLSANNNLKSDIKRSPADVPAQALKLLETECDCRAQDKDAQSREKSKRTDEGNTNNTLEDDVVIASRTFEISDHSPDCGLRKALVNGMASNELCDLVLAREDAHKNQTVLIARLKTDNRQLRDTYEDVCIRYQRLYEEQQQLYIQHQKSQQHQSQQAQQAYYRNNKQLQLEQIHRNQHQGSEGSNDGLKGGTGTDRLEVLSVRLQQAGQIACDVASRVEERLKITARDVSSFRRSIQHLPSQTQSNQHHHVEPTSGSSCDSVSSHQNAMRNDPKRNTIMTISSSESTDSSSVSSSPCRIRSPTMSLRATASTSARNPVVLDEYDDDSTCPEELNNANFSYALPSPSTKSPYGSNGPAARAKYVSRTEEEMEIEMEHYRHATDELMKTMALQQDAHNKLKATVHELTTELSRIDPNMLSDLKKFRQQAVTAEKKVSDVSSKLKKKDSEILDLRRQLTKVIAEYEAISVAHSYSNAELSKIRANNRGKTKQAAAGSGTGGNSGIGTEPKRTYVHGHKVLSDNGENRHHRRIHFR